MYNSLKMNIDVRLNRKLTGEDYVIPGEYEMVFAGRSIQFDFQKSCSTIDSEDASILHCELEHPDFNTFEDFRTITDAELQNSTEVTECYIYIGEECDPALIETGILNITFLLSNGDAVEINNDVIQKYNKTLMKGGN